MRTSDYVPLLLSRVRRAHPTRLAILRWRRFEHLSMAASVESSLAHPRKIGHFTGGFGILSNAPTQNQKVGQLKCIITYIMNAWNLPHSSSENVMTYIIHFRPSQEVRGCQSFMRYIIYVITLSRIQSPYFSGNISIPTTNSPSPRTTHTHSSSNGGIISGRG